MGELYAALSRCINPSFAALAKATHSQLLKLGNFSNLHLATRMLAAYSKCGISEDACELFDEITTTLSSLDIVSWNAIISGCVKNGRDEVAFQYFKRLQSDYRRLGADSYTLSSLLSSTHCLEKAITSGEQLHGYALKTGILSSVSVGNALITFYAAWYRLPDARMVFESMPLRDVVSWTALISGYARRCGHEEESLRLFVLMMSGQEGPRPNQFTFASVFGACGGLACLSQGDALISTVLKMGLLSDVHVQNSLIGFYSECGCLDVARDVFDAIIEPDIISWNSLLKGYSNQGRGEEALRILDEMIEVGAMPNSVTFISVLSACSHSGMTSQGLELFRRMEQDHGINPGTEHVSCIVNLLGRAGRLHQAVEFIRGFAFELGPSTWRTLLGACWVHGNAEELAEWAAAQLLRIEPRDAEAHVVLSNIYASSGRWDMVRNLRRSMKEKGVEKEPGSSWIEVGNMVHSFMSSDSVHPQMDEIEMRLMELTNNIKDQMHYGNSFLLFMEL
ncbi:pentatricopeptide repeat-containing protein At3g24000, mitochondrial-like [Magnolia sinica]|uniref:pentatricopeptide repeat-containing protein At3g24000, mitochondrial-like n=1 Tax=Magnolia sinica TaxID=86752 RepID=UPI00265829BB|nr:pentatricopeptide repeat-containing protein At3g24000, mitochondrial-like [Magnolia sinica]